MSRRPRIDETGAREPSPPSHGPADELQTEPGREGASESAVFDLEPESLRIRKEELEFMGAIRPLLGRTPRAVKRFVNVYRLVKSISLVQGQEFGAGQPGGVPSYQLSMFLLAVVTGLPGILGEVFHRIAGAIDDARPGRAQSERQTLGWLAEQLEAASGADGGAREVGRLTRWLGTCEQGAWKGVELAAFAAQVDAVARFSFRVEVGLEC